MRRADREITDINEILEIIKKCDVCRVAMSRGGVPYIVPMNFAHEYSNGALTLWFHCAKEGKKLDIIRENPYACFETDCPGGLTGGGDVACKYGMSYESVIGTGLISLCENNEDKRRGLTLLMEKHVPGKAFSFTDRQLDAVAVLRLRADSFTAKRKE